MEAGERGQITQLTQTPPARLEVGMGLVRAPPPVLPDRGMAAVKPKCLFYVSTVLHPYCVRELSLGGGKLAETCWDSSL